MNGIKAIYAVSMINRGPEKLGFQIRELPKGLFRIASTLYLKLLFSVIHPSGPERLNEKRDEMVPKMIVMPIDTLFDRFWLGDSYPTDQGQGKTDPIQEAVRASQAADTRSSS